MRPVLLASVLSVGCHEVPYAAPFCVGVEAVEAQGARSDLPRDVDHDRTGLVVTMRIDDFDQVDRFRCWTYEHFDTVHVDAHRRRFEATAPPGWRPEVTTCLSPVLEPGWHTFEDLSGRTVVVSLPWTSTQAAVCSGDWAFSDP